MGEEIDSTRAKKDCDPIITNKDMGVTLSFDGTALDENAIAYPCGLIAKSVFTDAYKVLAVKDDAGSELPIDDSDIAWKSDVEFKFKNQAGDWKKTQWLDVTDRKYFKILYLYRALHRVDEDCRSAKLSQALRQSEGRIEKRNLLFADREYIRCKVFRWLEVVCHVDNEHARRPELLPRSGLHRCWVHLPRTFFYLPHCLDFQAPSGEKTMKSQKICE